MADTLETGLHLHEEAVVHYQHHQLELAREKLARAVSIFKDVQDEHMLGTAQNSLGLVLYGLHEYDAAHEVLEQALSLRRSLWDRRGEGITCNSLGLVTLELGKLEEAREYLERSLVLRREVGDRLGEAKTLGNLGSTCQRMSLNEEAEGYYRESTDLLLLLGDESGAGDIFRKWASVYDDRGQLDKTEDCLYRALELLSDSHIKSRTYHDLAVLYHDQGQLEAAYEAFQQALTLARQAGDRRGEGHTLSMLSGLCYELGRFDDAVAYGDHALEAAREGGDRAGEAVALANAGLAYRDLNQPAQALENYMIAYAIAVELGDERMQGTGLNALGSLFQEMGDYERALEHSLKAVDLARRVGNPRGEAIALANSGDHCLKMDRDDQAQTYLQQALETATRQADHDAAWYAHSLLAQSCRRQGRLQDARRAYSAAIDLVEGLRVTVLSEDLRTSYFATIERFYTDYISLLIEMGEIERAFDVAEQGKARSMLDMLAEAQVDIRTGIDPALKDEEKRLVEEMGRCYESGDLSRLADLEKAYQLNQAEIRRQNPEYDALTAPQLWGIERIQSDLLDEDTVLLEYVVGFDESLLFVVTIDQVDVHVLPAQPWIESQVRALREAVTAHRESHAEAWSLFSELVRPAGAVIAGKDLLIVADDVLHYLPFALLLTAPPPDEEVLPFLIRSHAIRYAPSATVAGLLSEEQTRRRAAPPQHDGELAAFAAFTQPIDGHPVASRLPPLQYVEDEVWSLVGLFDPLSEDLPEQERPARLDESEVILRTGREATLSAVKSATSGERTYRFLHLATHGHLDDRRPQFSGLIFHPDDQGDAVWQVLDIFNASIPSDLVVLSACQTGMGRIVGGEGLVGLTRAFFFAQALALMVTLWEIDDVSTGRLMREFYAGVRRGESKCRALQHAQVAMLDDRVFAAPFYWAAFVLIGE